MAKKKTTGYEILKWAKAIDNQSELAVNTTLEISALTKDSKLISLADMSEIIDKSLIKTKNEVFDDEGCHVEGEIAKALEEYGIKKNSYDMAYFIMKKLREEFNSPDSKKEA